MKALNPNTGQFEEIYVKALDGLPIGTILEFPTTSNSKLPIGYMFCDGSAISRTTYSALFTLIGTSYGAGDGSTTFNLPNYKGRVPVGTDSTQTEFDTIGETGGEKTHKHTTSVGMDNGTFYSVVDSNNYPLYGSTVVLGKQSSGYLGAVSEGAARIGYTDNGSSLQPYIVTNYIIKVTETRALAGKVVNTNNDSTTDTYSCDFINKKTVNIYNNASGTSSRIIFDGNYEDYDYLIITSDVGTFLMYPKTHNTIFMSYTYYSDQLYQKYQVVSFEYDFSTEKSVAYLVMAGSYYSNANHSENLKIYKIVGVKL